MKIKKENKEDIRKEIQSKAIEIQMLESRLKQLEQSLNFIDQQIMEQQMLQLNLDELKKTKKGHEMLFPLGKNVFVKGKIENSDVIVVVGGNVAVKKNFDDAKDVIERQKMQIISIRDEISREIEKIIERISMLEKSIQ